MESIYLIVAFLLMIFLIDSIVFFTRYMFSDIWIAAKYLIVIVVFGTIFYFLINHIIAFELWQILN